MGIEEKLLNDLWRFDPEAGEWTQLAPNNGQAPSPRSFHSSVVAGGKVRAGSNVSPLDGALH